MLEPRIVAARIHGRFASAHGAEALADSTKLSSQGVFIDIRMPQHSDLVRIVELHRAMVQERFS
jgi:hypothetical protein